MRIILLSQTSSNPRLLSHQLYTYDSLLRSQKPNQRRAIYPLPPFHTSNPLVPSHSRNQNTDIIISTRLNHDKYYSRGWWKWILPQFPRKPARIALSTRNSSRLVSLFSRERGCQLPCSRRYHTRCLSRRTRWIREKWRVAPYHLLNKGQVSGECGKDGRKKQECRAKA